MTDRWIGKVKPDPRWREENPYLKKKEAEPAAEPEPEQAPKPTAGRGLAVLEDVSTRFLRLRYVMCVDADGNEIERYDRLHVARHVVYADESIGLRQRFTGYEAAHYFEALRNCWFLPSFALTCNILATLYANRDDTAVRGVLEQYNLNPGDVPGLSSQNTITDMSRPQGSQIIHYPCRMDFPNAQSAFTAYKHEINTDKTRKALEVDMPPRMNMKLEEALKYPHYRRFLQNLTGLRDPAVLLEIADYFGKPANICTQLSGKSSTSIGSGSNEFLLSLHCPIESTRDPARGVCPV